MRAQIRKQSEAMSQTGIRRRRTGHDDTGCCWGGAGGRGLLGGVFRRIRLDGMLLLMMIVDGCLAEQAGSMFGDAVPSVAMSVL